MKKNLSPLLFDRHPVPANKLQRYHSVFLSLFLLICLYFLPVQQSFAQWSTNPAVNNAISVVADEQNIPVIASDGADGAIIAWYDFRNGTDYKIYAQRIDSAGVVQWTSNGVAICNASGAQTNQQIVADGNGGAIITWTDIRSGTDYHVYAQLIDASGAVQWTANGVAICQANNSQALVKIISDGAGGAIIAWRDRRVGPPKAPTNIYAQRINSSGVIQWTTDGEAICNATGVQDSPELISDGSNGAIITWSDYRGGATADIYAQRIDGSGAVQWTTDGIAVCTSSDDQVIPHIVSDGSGGAIVTWSDFRNGSNYDIYAQQVSAVGTTGWTSNGEIICNASGDQGGDAVIEDGSGGAIITWRDKRSDAAGDIYVQLVNASGIVQWAANGEAICTVTGQQAGSVLTTDGSGGAIIAWSDFRGSDDDIYAQSIDATGTTIWTTDGILVSSASDHQYSPVIVASGGDNAIVSWTDIRNIGTTDQDIYAQRVKANGSLARFAMGTTKPVLSAFLSASVQPNPGAGYFNLTIKSDDNSLPVTVRVHDMHGKTISVYSNTAVNSILRIRSDKWQDGIYFAEVTQGQQRKVVKLLRSN